MIVYVNMSASLRASHENTPWGCWKSAGRTMWEIFLELKSVQFAMFFLSPWLRMVLYTRLYWPFQSMIELPPWACWDSYSYGLFRKVGSCSLVLPAPSQATNIASLRIWASVFWICPRTPTCRHNKLQWIAWWDFSTTKQRGERLRAMDRVANRAVLKLSKDLVSETHRTHKFDVSG